MNLNDLDFEQMPRDAGQIVNVTYAVDWESDTLYRRTADRSRPNSGIAIHEARIISGEFDPQNGSLPEHGEWMPADEATAAEDGRGLHYRSAEWQRLAERCQWQGIWPVIDADGDLTGEISEGGEDESNVDDEAMIDTDAARAAGWKVEDGYASPPSPVAVEFAVCDETIRTCAIDDLIGLEHTAAAEACAAYHRAATQALIDDTRAGRLTVSSPRGQRRLHSQWMGSGFKFSAGAIGTMGDLTEDEKAAVSAADDAGREAARKIAEAADAAEIQ
jgi:hypothetical protein